MPLVSVIIPTYNRAHTIKRAISSVLNQTFQNFEIIVIDDGSIDNTEAVIKNIDSDKILYFKNQHRGVSAARNYGIENSKGKYISFLDSDDEYKKDKLKIQVKFLEKNKDIGLVYTHCDIYDNKKSSYKLSWKGTIEGSVYPKLLYIKNNVISTPTVMVRKEVFNQVGLFDVNLATCEDIDLWLRISKIFKISVIKKVLVNIYNDFEKNSNKNLNQRKKFYSYCIRKYPELIKKQNSLLDELNIHQVYKEIFINKSGKKAISIIKNHLNSKKGKDRLLYIIKIIPYYSISLLINRN